MPVAVLETHTPDEFMRKGAALLAAHLRFATKEHARCVVGLSGGSTPKSVYKALTEEQNIQWEHVWLFLVDDRYVPADHQDSNQAMIQECLLRHINIPEEQILFPDTALPLKDCIENYDRRLDTLLRRGTPDLVILGMGDDGHIASLFPPLSGDAFSATKRAIHTTTDKFAVHDRITVTLPVLQSTKIAVFLLKGGEKRKVWEEMVDSKEDPRRWPAQLVLKEGRPTAVFGV